MFMFAENRVSFNVKFGNLRNMLKLHLYTKRETGINKENFSCKLKLAFSDNVHLNIIDMHTDNSVGQSVRLPRLNNSR